MYLETNLYFYDEVLKSSQGMQQGDGNSTYGFCLGIQRLIEQCTSLVKIFYLDDGTLIDYPEKVLSDLSFIINEGSKIGLSLNSEKSEITLLNFDENKIDSTIASFEALAPGIKIIPRDKQSLLGAPLGDVSRDEMLTEKKDDLKRMISRLCKLDVHDALFLLKKLFCYSEAYIPSTGCPLLQI